MVTNALEARITTLYFCPVRDTEGRLILGSTSGGVRSLPNHQQWWPQIVGQEVENLGNILIVDVLPTTAHLGVYIVAYGIGEESSRLTIVPDSNLVTPIFEYSVPISFTQTPPSKAPGVAATQKTLLNCHFESAGLYWLTATIGVGIPTRIPLDVQQRDEWQHAEHERIEQLRAAGLLPPHQPTE